MKRIDCGTSGTFAATATTTWTDLHLGEPWTEMLEIVSPGRSPRPAQLAALGKEQILESRRNVIISAPTNGGKSLIGLLTMLDAVRRKRRALLLEPLRAIAREKTDELQAVAPRIATVIGCPLHVRISTGDYRLDDETLTAPPPDEGEIIIATPERIEAVLRNPDHDDWLASIGVVCVDEAHLIGSPRRGPTLEYLITSLLCLRAPPRLVLLSATLGNLELASSWLSPCDVVSVQERQPPLHKEVLELSAKDDANQVVVAFVRNALADAGASVLVFVYQTRSTEHLADLLREALGRAAGSDGPLAYHARMSVAQREGVRGSFGAGRCRCVVSTTALGLGVNLPATHVLARDTTFAGVGPVGVSDLLQMMGRAGRGDSPGRAAAIVRANDAWNANELAQALRREELPSLASHFDRAESPRRRHGRAFDDGDIAATATLVAAQLARHAETGLRTEDLRLFFERSLGGGAIAGLIGTATAWLTDPSRSLAFRDEDGRFRTTVLGLNATRAVLPLNVAAGIAQLMRDVLSIDALDELLSSWRPLDHLIVLELLSDRAVGFRPFSGALADQLDTWMEAAPDRTPMLYRQFIAGPTGTSRASEVLGSLGITPGSVNGGADERAHKQAYLAVLRAVILYERGQGLSTEELERRWQLTGLDGVEERWRDDLLWLLSGLAKILDLRCFFFHLREDCRASADRIRRVKGLLATMRAQAFELQEDLKYCSPLGPVLRSIRRTRLGTSGQRIGTQSIRRLEEGGVRSLAELARLDVDDLIRLGVRRDLAKQIRTYVARRLQ